MFYKVVVRKNLIEEIRHQRLLVEDQQLLHTNLEAGASLAQNFQQFGCIDSDYFFDDSERAKAFASMCMDFMNKLIDSRMASIDRLDHDQEYIAEFSNQR